MLAFVRLKTACSTFLLKSGFDFVTNTATVSTSTPSQSTPLRANGVKSKTDLYENFELMLLYSYLNSHYYYIVRGMT